MILAMFCFVANDAMVRTVGQDLPVSQIMFLRGLIVVALTTGLILRSNRQHQLQYTYSPLVVVRSLLDLAGTAAFLYALMRVPFANAAAVLQCLPLAVTLGAAIVFREKVGIWRWSAIAIGFAGVLVILRPGLDGFTPASLWLLATVVFSAARDLLSRSLQPDVPTLMVTLSVSLTITIAGLVFTLFAGNWQAMSAQNWGHLIVAAFFLFGAYQFIVITMRTGDTSLVAPFRYTSLLWAIIVGWWWFQELPDKHTILGSLIVACMGLLTIYRERRLAATK